MSETKKWITSFTTTTGSTTYSSVGLTQMRSTIRKHRESKDNSLIPTIPLMVWALRYVINEFNKMKEKSSKNKDMSLVMVTMESEEDVNPVGGR